MTFANMAKTMKLNTSVKKVLELTAERNIFGQLVNMSENNNIDLKLYCHTFWVRLLELSNSSWCPSKHDNGRETRQWAYYLCVITFASEMTQNKSTERLEIVPLQWWRQNQPDKVAVVAWSKHKYASKLKGRRIYFVCESKSVNFTPVMMELMLLNLLWMNCTLITKRKIIELL